MDPGLGGKVALVAAASQGLGKAVATELAREGCHLILCARGAETLSAAADAIRCETGAQVLPVVADLSRSKDIAALLARATGAHGRIDILVTNAGGPPSGPFEDHDAATWEAAVHLTLRSVVELCRGVVPGMKLRRFGRVLNITSITVKQPVDGLILSNSIRAAVTGFARTLANEVAPFGVTVNNLLPGYTRTARLEQLAANLAAGAGVSPGEVIRRWEREIPMARLGDPGELAALAAFLASDRAAYITGQSIAVDGGWIRSLV